MIICLAGSDVCEEEGGDLTEGVGVGPWGLEGGQTKGGGVDSKERGWGILEYIFLIFFNLL